ncbi:MAG: hypothetical protein ACOYVK_09015 [Bacillota bacterium]
MYSNIIKDRVLSPFGKIEKINAISKEVQIKRERYGARYIQEKNKGYTEQFRMEDKHMIYERPRFFPPTEVYLNHINSRREFIYALSINAHAVYQDKEDVLGKNIDAGI